MTQSFSENPYEPPVRAEIVERPAAAPKKSARTEAKRMLFWYAVFGTPVLLAIVPLSIGMMPWDAFVGLLVCAAPFFAIITISGIFQILWYSL